MNYTDTVGVDLSQYSIDSLLKEVDIVDTMKATDVTLYLKAKNTIPLDVYASMRCLDATGQVMKDPEDPTKPLLLFPSDTITLKAPNYEKDGGNWVPKSPGETVITAQLTKRQVDLLPLIKHIRYTAIINDKSLSDAYSKGLSNIRITDDQGLTLRIGVTAHVDAILNFDGNKNK